jgi:hypothetical protein
MTHRCTFPEITVGSTLDPDDPLQPGMHVLAPCECGETPLDHMDWLETHNTELDAAIINVEPRRALFHWAPATRRRQIIRYGLRPNMRATTSSNDEGWRAPVICLADTPSWAWALSGGMPYTPAGVWDLWQTSLDELTDPVVLPSTDRASGIHEVRTEHRIYKRNLWLVASREKTAS